MSELVVVEFNVTLGRSDVQGMFICSKGELSELYGKKSYIGESYLGKHGYYTLTLDRPHFSIKSEDQDFVTKCLEIFGESISGYNPFDNIEE